MSVRAPTIAFSISLCIVFAASSDVESASRKPSAKYSCIAGSRVPMTKKTAKDAGWRCINEIVQSQNAETPDFPEPKFPLIANSLCLAYVSRSVNAWYASGPQACTVSCEGPRSACR